MEMIVSALELTPATLIRIVDQVKPDRYHEKLEEGRFSLSEMVAHVADLEDVFLDRMRLAVEFPGSPTEAIDPDARAISHHYADKEIYHELEVFTNRRRDTIYFLKGLAVDDWALSVVHPALGTMSVLDIATMALAHDLFHLEQASHYMR